jgi:hypothetical protein
MDGVDVSWARTPFGTPIAQKIASITKAFNSDAPQASVPALVALLGDVDQTVATNKAFQTVRLTEGANTAYDYWHKQKTKELKDIIAACAGLWFEAYVDEPAYAMEENISVRAQVIEQGDANINFAGISLVKPDIVSTDTAPLMQNQLKTVNLTLKADKLSQPYWLETSHGIGNYTINDELKVGNPENPDAPAVLFLFNIGGKQIEYTRKLVFKYVDPARGEIYQPLEITPPVTANIAEKVYIYNNTQAANRTGKTKKLY